jgi:5'-nucleotidase
MRILITNDDGINARGLAVLHAIAGDVAGPEGEVWTVAPAFEQSGVSHCISYSNPTLIAQLGPRSFAAEGSPADCVLAGVHDVLKDSPPDLVLSGVNRGNNCGENTLYSGTIGGAMEGALQGLPAIALSQYYGPGNAGLDNPFEAAAEYGADLVRRLLQQGAWDRDADYRTFYSINFPPVPAAGVLGTQATVQGMRPGVKFAVEPHVPPNGRRYMWIRGGPQDVGAAPGSDVQANLDGYISVTPMRADLTAYDRMDTLRAVLE